MKKYHSHLQRFWLHRSGLQQRGAARQEPEAPMDVDPRPTRDPEAGAGEGYLPPSGKLDTRMMLHCLSL